MKSVLILLSTYNGGKYLREQLDSLYTQQGVNIHILVRDDGSRDNTLVILKEYQELKGNMTILAEKNVGCVRSFFSLLQYANSNYINRYDYYAFCDQDDQWLPSKLCRAVECLDKSENNLKLYFCSANYVDVNLHLIKVVETPDFFDYRSCLYKQPALGCTMVFSGDLLRSCNMAPKEQPNLHDAWMFMCANYLGADIIADRIPMINYRQHGNNVTTANQTILKRYWTALKLRLFKEKGITQKYVTYFYNTYKDFLSEEKQIFLRAIIGYNSSVFSMIKLLKLQPFNQCGFLDKIFWRLLIVLKFY